MKTTKNILIGVVAILTLLLFFQACDKSNGTDFTGKYTIEKGETINIPQNTKLAQLTFQESTDSRCPINANCVWQGAAQAKFIVKTEQKEQTLDLCLGGCDVIAKNRKQKLSINGEVYFVELVELTPYPTTEKPLQTPKATLLVQKK